MSDLEEYTRVIKLWKDQQHKTISDVLLRILKVTNKESEEDLTKLLDALGNFHKQANVSPAEKVDEGWFKHIQKSKNYLKVLIQQVKKGKIKKPKLIKSNSNIEFPQQLVQNKDKDFKQTLKILYKSFLTNLDEQFLKEKQKIIDYFSKVTLLLFEEFGIKADQKRSKQQKLPPDLQAKKQKICKQLSRISCSLAKKQMLQGKIDPSLVAKLDPFAFVGEQAQKIRQKKYQQFMKQHSTGFYDELKKNINKDANQECRYCHKNAAYCEGQKQIRASDQPMTRFMKCNQCGQRWRQQ